MALKTQGVHDLVIDTLAQIAKPYSEDIIQGVFVEIQNNCIMSAKYDAQVTALGKTVANQWVGEYVRREVGGAAIAQVPVTRTKLVGSYSTLRF
jgi:hypothetical protein